LAQADAIVVIGRDMREKIERKLPAGHQNRVQLIPNWADSALIKPRLKAGTVMASRDHRFQQNFVVQYSGNIGLTQRLDVLLRAAAILRNEPVLFTVVGTGAALAELKELASRGGLDQVLFQRRVDESELADSLAACDASLVSLDGRLLGCSVPSKFYGILASGRPVLAAVPALSEVALAVREHDCGIVVTPGDAQALVDAINSLRVSQSLCSRLGQNARRAFEENYTRERAARQYFDVVSGLAGAPNSRKPDGRRDLALNR
jgi:glycosyltransferase involved in cell wall biosynthesis